MKIVVAHNHYQQPGGEDTVVASEIELLKSAGHEVVEYRRFNSDLDRAAWPGKLKAARDTLWAADAKREFADLLARTEPEVAHFHNTFPLISPAVYYACRAAGVAVVQTLHNYRLLCPGVFFSRQGRVCEDCTGKAFAWPGVAHACFRGSRAQTAVSALMLTMHRGLKTWQRQVDVYIALTDFARRKFIEGGLPAERLMVKPNFVSRAPETPSAVSGGGDDVNQPYALFVGRLSPEKGVETMLAAWEQSRVRLSLKIVGAGPLGDKVKEVSNRLPNVELLGQVPRHQVLELMRNALVLILPSLWYEGFPMVIAEAFAMGLPVIASNLGSMSSLIETNRTGLHFKAGDAGDLAAQVAWCAAHPEQLGLMRAEVGEEFRAKYTAERNYETLIKIYHAAIASARTMGRKANAA